MKMNSEIFGFHEKLFIIIFKVKFLKMKGKIFFVKPRSQNLTRIVKIREIVFFFTDEKLM